MQMLRPRFQAEASGSPAAPAELSYRREIAARARDVVSDLYESGRGFVGYDTRRSPIDGGYAFTDVREAVSRMASRQGLELTWYGCDDIGMAVDVVGRS
jgi:hypothetical protein